MRLAAPTQAPQLAMTDIYGEPVAIGSGRRRTLLCFFRDAACPFCNFRIYELTQHHASLAALGLDIVAVFASSPEEVKRFVARKPRPFRVIADPASSAYDAYGIERSFWRKLKAIATRLPTLLRGLRIVGLAGLDTNNILPADFLIDENGRVVEAYYGRDAGDHIPFERVELFLARGLIRRSVA
ncbi:MAG: redoxin domain-containing protein [Mizugakiibacter sp.]|uniref:redoxin domain-containing protein n=1 Tax=Mizugakiibacter sp. TaxID=1972610 RepID=UPI0031C0F145|nr:redoxin domain-containing protein [Xanthomonadaceae bacterium]